jgi:hypothetical protein
VVKTIFNLALAFSIYGIVLTSGTNCFAQTQTVTLAVNAQNYSSSYAAATNQVIQLTSITGVQAVTLFHSSGAVVGANEGTYTGLTNISFSATVTSFTQGGITHFSTNDGLVTLTIMTPSNPVSNVVSNYVPADAIVIPASATGNVQIILESSPDLVNWTAASPGTYGASAGTNRFFRVRAAVSP